MIQRPSSLVGTFGELTFPLTHRSPFVNWTELHLPILPFMEGDYEARIRVRDEIRHAHGKHGSTETLAMS